MVLKNSSEIIKDLEQKLISLGYNINLNDYSDILIKKIPKSEALSGNTHQTHLAITGEAKAMFPVLLNLYYYEKKETSLKSKDLPKIEVILLKKNLEYMGLTGLENKGDIIKTFTVSKVSARTQGESQIELSDVSVDGKDFQLFRKALKEGDFLIALKNKITGNFLFICIRSSDIGQLVSRDGYYMGDSQKTVQEINFIKDVPTTQGKVDENFWDYVNKNQINFLTFHPSYSYQEFIEGISFDSEKQSYFVKDGIFKEFCFNAIYRALTLSGVEEKYDISNPRDYTNIKKEVQDYLRKGTIIDWDRVLNDPSGRFCFIVDEINRGDISKIFGELITLLEKDKRLGGGDEIKVQLPYSREIFGIPLNIFFLGTMNTADRSIALIDVALRRRFGFIGFYPDFSNESALINNLKEKGVYDLAKPSIEAIKIINNRLEKYSEIGKDKCIGHSFFFNICNEGDIENVWKHEIIPLLEEYCYSDNNLLNEIYFAESNENSDSVLKNNKLDISLLLQKIISSNEKSQGI